MFAIAASVMLAALAVVAFGPSPALLAAGALAAVAPTLWRVDVAEHRLPNRSTYFALLLGAVGAGVSWVARGTPSLVPLVAALAVGGLLLLLALMGGMGMGDVKLAAAIGLASPTLEVAIAAPLLAFLLGGVAAIVVIARRGWAARKDHIPFGPFLLAGYFVAVALTALGRSIAT